MLWLRAALLCVVLWLDDASVVAVDQCVEPNNLMFCKAVNWKVLGSASGFVQDSQAKALYDSVLNTMSFCKNVVLTNRCSVAFRKYSCAVHFPECTPSAVVGSVNLTRPCRSLCEEYCSECKLSHCPCADLPPDGHSCKGLVSYCPTCIASTETTSTNALDNVEGRCTVHNGSAAEDCPWALVEVTSTKSGATSARGAPGRILALVVALGAASLAIGGGRH